MRGIEPLHLQFREGPPHVGLQVGELAGVAKIVDQQESSPQEVLTPPGNLTLPKAHEANFTEVGKGKFEEQGIVEGQNRLVEVERGVELREFSDNLHEVARGHRVVVRPRRSPVSQKRIEVVEVAILAGIEPEADEREPGGEGRIGRGEARFGDAGAVRASLAGLSLRDRHADQDDQQESGDHHSSSVHQFLDGGGAAPFPDLSSTGGGLSTRSSSSSCASA